MTIGILEAPAIHPIHLLEGCWVNFTAVVTCYGGDTVYVFFGVH